MTGRVDSLKKVTEAVRESDTLPHIRGNRNVVENLPEFFLNRLLEYKRVKGLMNSPELVFGLLGNMFRAHETLIRGLGGIIFFPVF